MLRSAYTIYNCIPPDDGLGRLKHVLAITRVVAVTTVVLDGIIVNLITRAIGYRTPE
jgi:hypothetical protein